MSTPKKNLDVERVAEQLMITRGNMAAVARAFGVDRSAVWKFVQRHEHLKKVCDEAKQIMLDTAESSLFKAIDEGEGWAVCFYLKTQGKSRGYVQTVTVESAKKPKQKYARHET